MSKNSMSPEEVIKTMEDMNKNLAQAKELRVEVGRLQKSEKDLVVTVNKLADRKETIGQELDQKEAAMMAGVKDKERRSDDALAAATEKLAKATEALAEANKMKKGAADSKAEADRLRSQSETALEWSNNLKARLNKIVDDIKAGLK